MTGLVSAYRCGRNLNGWVCRVCQVRFPHYGGRQTRTYARFLAHKIRRRHALHHSRHCCKTLTVPPITWTASTSVTNVTFGDWFRSME